MDIASGRIPEAPAVQTFAPDVQSSVIRVAVERVWVTMGKHAFLTYQQELTENAGACLKCKDKFGI